MKSSFMVQSGMKNVWLMKLVSCLIGVVRRQSGCRVIGWRECGNCGTAGLWATPACSVSLSVSSRTEPSSNKQRAEVKPNVKNNEKCHCSLYVLFIVRLFHTFSFLMNSVAIFPILPYFHNFAGKWLQISNAKSLWWVKALHQMSEQKPYVDGHICRAINYA